MTTMDDLIVGSTSYIDIQKRGLGSGRLHGDRVRVPGGTLHAVTRGTRNTLCGAPIDRTWDEHSWNPNTGIGVTYCDTCREQAPASTA